MKLVSAFLYLPLGELKGRLFAHALL